MMKFFFTLVFVSIVNLRHVNISLIFFFGFVCCEMLRNLIKLNWAFFQIAWFGNYF